MAGRAPGRWKGGYVCRCRRPTCRMYGKRIWRKHKPVDYWGANRRYGVCPACDNTLTIDRYRSSGFEAAATKCRCEGYPFIHRRGSLFCEKGEAIKAGFGYADRRGDAFLLWRETGVPF